MTLGDLLLDLTALGARNPALLTVQVSVGVLDAVAGHLKVPVLGVEQESVGETTEIVLDTVGEIV